MDADTRRRVLLAARMLVQHDQETFAAALKVGTATLKRMEAGYLVSEATAAQMMGLLGELGVIVIERSTIGGLEVRAGVALLVSAEVGPRKPLRVDAKPGIRKAASRKLVAEGEPGGAAVEAEGPNARDDAGRVRQKKP